MQVNPLASRFWSQRASMTHLPDEWWAVWDDVALSDAFHTPELSIPSGGIKYLSVWPLAHKDHDAGTHLLLDSSGEAPSVTAPLKIAFDGTERGVEVIKGKIFEGVKTFFSSHIKKPPRLRQWDSVHWSARWDSEAGKHELTILATVKVTVKAKCLNNVKLVWIDPQHLTQLVPWQGRVKANQLLMD